MRNLLIIFIILKSSVGALAQYAPAAGQAGSTAIYADSSVFKYWAESCNVSRGPMNISDPSIGLASAGNPSDALGKALGNGTLSLGDGGSATLYFSHAIQNGPGYDFAVFENSFSDTFLELAFVEVSNDGINFYRFPCQSLTDTTVQTGSFGNTDPQKINNLAGKYRMGYGTPFDLNELKGASGLDVNNVHYVRVMDVIGSVDPKFASRDSSGRMINDPWPTSFASGGFDLDAVGVINASASAGIEDYELSDVNVFPNIITQGSGITISGKYDKMNLYKGNGTIVFKEIYTLNAEDLERGFYLLEISKNDKRKVFKLIKL